jgi:hypothetical protein
MERWSKLEVRLRRLADPALGFRVRFTRYRAEKMPYAHPYEESTRIWITLGKDTIWSVPRDMHSGSDTVGIDLYSRRGPEWLVELAAQYLDVPRDRLIEWTPDWMGWGLVDLLKASDRRIGRRQWARLRSVLTEPAALRVLDLRAGRVPATRLRVAGRDSGTMHNPD